MSEQEKRKIFTGCWFENYPSFTCIKIGISRGTPRGMPAGYRMFRKLAPGSWFNSVSPEVYRDRYFDILRELDPLDVMFELFKIAGDRTPILVCYESPRNPLDWCHRGYVSAWFADTIQLDVHEYGYESEGVGWMHPKLPAQHRKKVLSPPLPVEPLDVTAYIGAEATDKNGQVWTVIGTSPEFPDQALVESGKDVRAISAEVLKAWFQPRA